LASVFAVSRSLVGSGIEMFAIRSLLKNMNFDCFKSASDQMTHLAATSSKEKQKSLPATSIFDSFDVAPKQSGPLSSPHSGQASSSIFDSFDTQYQKPKAPASTPVTGDMSSSIFNAFDAPSTPKVPAQGAKDMTSSIFDSFDPPPPVEKQTNHVSSAAMESSIFDTFDACPALESKSITPAVKSAETKK